MSGKLRMASLTHRCAWLLACLVILCAMSVARAAEPWPDPAYRATYGWEKLPAGMKLGVVSGIFPDPDGRHLWVLSRCGGNDCAGTERHPVLKFDLQGNLVFSFGKGILAWPHGFFRDHEGNLWVTEGAPAGDDRGASGFRLGKGHQVFKFSSEGHLLLTLGTAGVAGDGPTEFNGPSGVAVARNGDIWIVDGHRGGNNRMMRFSRDGRLIRQWGGGIASASAKTGEFDDPHHIAIDSIGRLFVSDRNNNRIQIFDPEGKFIAEWKQFGRPSGIYIAPDDTIYVADGMSGLRHNAGGQKGIRIGDARTGRVTHFIPDAQAYVDGESGVEFLAADAMGNIYAGEVTRQRLVKFVPVRR